MKKIVLVLLLLLLPISAHANLKGVIPNAGNLTGVLPVANGGTGQSLSSTASLARQLIAALPATNIGVDPLGDSETAGANGVNSGVPLYNNSSDWIGLAIATSGGRFSYVANDGVAGNTCAQVLARVSTVISHHPKVVPIVTGTNDEGPINSATQTYAGLMNCEEKMIAQLLEAGILPIIGTVPPNNTYPAIAKRIRFFQYELAQYYNLPFIDIHATLVNPTNGQFISGTTSDGTHLNAQGVINAQAAIVPVLSNLAQPEIYPYFGDVAETTNTETSNLVMNGNFANSLSGTWTTNSTGATITTPAASYPYNGNSLLYVKASAGAVFAFQQAGSGITVASGAIAVGDTMYFAGRCNASGLAYSAPAVWLMEVANVTASVNYRYYSAYNGDTVFTGTWVIPASTTSLSPDMFTSVTGTYTCNNYTIVDLTKQNSIWQPGQQGL